MNVKNSDLQNLFKERLEKNENKKNLDFIKNKLILLISIFLKDQNFNLKEHGDSLKNILSILKVLFSDDKRGHLSSLFEFCDVLDEKSEFIFEITIEILELCLINTNFFIEKNQLIKQVLKRLMKNYESKKNIIEVYILYAKILNKLGDYSVCKDNYFLSPSVNRGLYVDDDVQNEPKYLELNRMMFYLYSTNISIIDLKVFRHYENPDLQEETNLQKQMMKHNPDFGTFNVEYFDKTYGKDFGNKYLI